ncbi:hypothetical protein GCM10025791_29380 [Halioxenophilus aromaticivorans]|uniref:Carboxylesterase type B domain-containing protein n=1 Tax=Halioxenophilus aromaticivorans TaxID=1306992 RepID=A0AAV3U535_9ALTE
MEDEYTGVVAFKGIHYAAPPRGENRFRPRAPPANRSELLLATAYGSKCAQTGGSFGSASVSEDCLYLNVFTPDTTGEFPVMVWIHGGAFVAGSGNDPENGNPDYQPTYHPKVLVGQGVVVVTLNYRLRILGFLSHPILSVESGMGSGNYGIMDQQAALAWVQSNIEEEEYGGDPSNVTIFGESAGGHSVMTQLVSSQAQGLFHKAIVQSGTYAPSQLSLPLAEAIGAATPMTLGCDSAGDSAACLRRLPVQAILAAQGPVYLPSVDGNV